MNLLEELADQVAVLSKLKEILGLKIQHSLALVERDENEDAFVTSTVAIVRLHRDIAQCEVEVDSLRHLLHQDAECTSLVARIKGAEHTKLKKN